MTQRAYSRGWPIEWNENQWIYSDTLEPDDGMRKCRKCGRIPTPDGYDACLGYIEGVKSACCGHGVKEPYRIQK